MNLKSRSVNYNNSRFFLEYLNIENYGPLQFMFNGFLKSIRDLNETISILNKTLKTDFAIYLLKLLDEKNSLLILFLALSW